MTAIVKHQGYASVALMGEDYDRVERMATGLAKSGMFKDVSTTALAMAKILIGADMGLTPTQALMSIDVVRGNVQIRGKRLLAWVRESDRYDAEIVERTPERGAIQFFEKSKRDGEWRRVGPLLDPMKPEGPENPPQPIRFTLAEAEAAGLVKDGSGWKNWPANMCLWRCTSIGVNLFCSDLVGGHAVYTEADSFVSTATEIGAGEGDGSEPGWSGLEDEQVADIEALLAVAAELGTPLDRAAVQLKLSGRPDAVAAWLEDTAMVLARHQEAEGEQQTLDTDEPEATP